MDLTFMILVVGVVVPIAALVVAVLAKSQANRLQQKIEEIERRQWSSLGGDQGTTQQP